MPKPTLRIALYLLAFGGCQGAHSPCADNQVRVDGACQSYQAQDPYPTDARPVPPKTSWQWQLTDTLDLSYAVDLYDIDLFETTTADIAQLRASGKQVICYFSAGSYEPWRDDARDFPSAALGRPLAGWPDERWLNINTSEIRAIMLKRLDLAKEKGCDGVEPDNITAAFASSGFGITPTEQLAFNRFLADEAHRRGLSIALKNDVSQADALVDWFDFTVNESCDRYDECDALAIFVAQDKGVLHTEYIKQWSMRQARALDVCGKYNGFSTIIKLRALDAPRLGCQD